MAGAAAGRLAEGVRLLADRRFRRWFVARWVSVTGSTISPAALAWAILHMGGGASGIAAVLLGGPIVFLALSPIGGVLADRYPRITIMVVCQIVSGAAQALSAALILTGTATVPTLAGLALLAGAAGAFFTPASQGVLPALVATEHMAAANALRQIANNSVMIIGPSVAGAVIAVCGAGWVLAWDSVTFAVSGVLLADVRVPARSHDKPRQPIRMDLVEGWAAFRSRRWLVILSLVSTVTGAAWVAAINVLGPLAARDTLGGPLGWGIVQSAIGVGFIAGSMTALAVRPHRIGLVVAGGYVPDIVFLGTLASGAPLAIVAASAIAAGSSATFQMIVWQSHLQTVVPDEHLSRVMSTVNMLGGLGVPIAYGTVGAATAAFGVRPIQWACAAIVAAAAVTAFTSREVRRLRAEPAADLAAAEAPA
ncbi:sugar (and other) transporter family protein [Actinomadura verrucosospora]|uniref:Sugar (And other) transporter family protein n=2 Tax=Actinomadura verrucosospora TaxID=46165 RepID=A0A7D4ACF7_ACTVE|nr:sugar (and other) transporter family protein [Actinomadura verrucosospora]